MRKIFTIAFCCIWFCVTASAAYAATGSRGNSAENPVIAAVQKRHAAMKSMRAEFSQVLTHKESGGTEKRSGVLYFAKPLLVRWETKKPLPEMLLVTPEAVWSVFPDEDMAYKYPPEISAESAEIVRLVTGQGNWAEDFDIENQKIENGIARIVLFPKNPTQSMTEAELLVEMKTGRITYVKITDFYYNLNEITFTTQEIDPDIQGMFAFTPPKGMTVEDKTKSGVQSKPLLQ